MTTPAPQPPDPSTLEPFRPRDGSEVEEPVHPGGAGPGPGCRGAIPPSLN